jgi:dolichyl-diphosphooligosaccharide--protein glycosyltransferase/undecaprenyl-diphosphooligosaccharide--protein glycosyltransferase
MRMTDRQKIFIYILVAYAFSVLVRMIWVWQFHHTQSFMWNNQLMINTNDGYVFAEKARDILNGTIGYLDGVNGDGAVGFVTAVLANILPFSFETIILYMPTFLGSLLVVPLVMIGKSLHNIHLGFIAALLASITWSYYNRTMTGYYDSDMLNIVTPMFVMWSIIHALITQKNRYLVLMILFMMISAWWYPKNIALNTAMLFMGGIYVLIKERHNFFNMKLLAFGIVGLSLLPFVVKIALTAGLFLLFHYRESLSKKYIYYLLSGLIILYFFSGAFYSIWSSFNLYVIHRFFPNSEISNITQLQFYDVIKTVREASAISFETFANRISGHVLTFFLSTIGIVLMILRYPVMIISLPMVAMGYMAYKSGLRFTVYAVPIYALGFGYLVTYVITFFSGKTKKEKLIKSSLAFAVVALALYANIIHVMHYRVPTVLSKAEVNDLYRLKNISTPKDYTVAWWDYGYPIRYYSYTKTLIDGGKHNHDNYLVSKILQTSSPEMMARLSRLSVETYVKNGYVTVADTLFKNGTKKQLDPNLMLSDIEDGTYRLPKKTRDIFIYLPYRMLDIFPTVVKFGNLDLLTGKTEYTAAFYPTFLTQQSKGIFAFRNGIVFNAHNGTLSLGRQKKEVKYFIVTQNTNTGEVKLQSQIYHIDGGFAVIFMKSYNRFIIMDMETFKSMYVQMFILGKYNKNFFDLVISSPYSRIYKLKI